MKEKIIICPNTEKMNILQNLSNDNNLYNIKFMTKEEYLSNYYFDYNEEAIFYLMNKYNLHIDVAKVYLRNLYIIDIEKDYKNKKLIFLKDIKQDLINNKLLTISNSFKKYISNKEIEVHNYYDLDLYEEIALNYKFNNYINNLNTKVYEFSNIEEEVNYTCIEIIKLLEKGIDINKIHLCNISNEYYYTIKKLFSYYNIPIEIPFKNSIYGTKIVKDYLDKGIINLESNDPITKKLVSVINSLSTLDKDNPIYLDILKDKLKDTYLDNKLLDNKVSISNLYDKTFSRDEYVFVLGFNQDALPKIEKDINYITDNDKEEIDMYTTTYINKREKDILVTILSNIDNLYLSYKKSSPFSEYYPSSLINELNLEVVKDYKDDFNYSNFYNKIRLGEKLDNYKLYGEKEYFLSELNSHYNIDYDSYSNEFTGINNDLYLENLAYPLKLSYTSLNSYNECAFKYFIRHVLKLDEYESTFPAFIGSLYHEILSLYKNDNFDFETEYNNYLEKRELSLKEKLLLVRIKKDLIEFLNVIKSQETYTKYNDSLFERYVEVNIRDDISVKFIGFIDKIMYMKKIEDTYFSIVDYKTGTIDTHIEPMKYGLHMQLPVYLYLISYGKVFSNPIFTGIYYQNILYPYPKWSEKLESEMKDRYLLKGYSTDNTEVLENFDCTYKDSSYIKSMKYTEDKGFDRFSKIISDDTLYSLIKYTDKLIKDKTDDIINSKFDINPKVYAGSNVSCEWCSYKDLCYMKDKDLKYLEKQDDLSFLEEGDE